MGASLTSKFHKCVANRESASYPFGSRHETLDLMRKYAEWIDTNGRELNITILKYLDGKTMGGHRDAIMFTFKLGGSRDGFLPINCQMIFPPHFPKVPPIFAIKAAGIPKFDRSRHAKHPLPTRTFEVKLETFQFKTQPERLMQSFLTILSREFPVQPVKQLPVVVFQFPERFDDRYNNTATIFPFDCNLKVVRTSSGDADSSAQRMRAEYVHDLDSLRDHFQKMQHDPMPIPKATSSDNTRATVQMKDDTAQMRMTSQRLSKRITEFDGVAVEDIVTKQQRTEEIECFELESKLIGIRETIGFVEDQLADNHSANFNEVFQKLSELYEYEFEVARKAKAVPVLRRFFGKSF